jgi:hypothetical protein
MDWSRHFAQTIAAAPTAYGLEKRDADALVAACQEYADAYTLAVAPATRTKASIAEKDRSRKAMLQVLRRYARLIKANPAVSDERKVILQLTASSQPWKRGDAPATRPILQVVSAIPLRHVLRCTDSANAEGSAKPAGVTGMQLFCHVGSEAPADPLDARFERFVTRSQHVVEFKPAQVGKTAFYFARWQNATGETGPWSQVARMTVAG